MKILADATLPHLLNWFPKPFSLTIYHSVDELTNLLKSHDILLCRSTLKVTEALLRDSTIQCVATASSGIDHIDSSYLEQKQITLLDAKGSNARSVADYVLTNIAVLQRNNAFKGSLAGVIGFGEVGSQVSKLLKLLNFEVIHYDPLKALYDPHFKSVAFEALSDCNLICVHANLHNSSPFPSRNLLNKSFLKSLKPQTVIINAARGSIINENDLLETNQSIIYCTDVYNNEPEIDSRIVDFATICTPHIAGHSIEAKEEAIAQLSHKLHRFYNLPIISDKFLSKVEWTIKFDSSWQEKILKYYNPMHETLGLKAAIDKKEAFLKYRIAHSRHEFKWY